MNTFEKAMKRSVELRIKLLKEKLLDSDYKIIKCTEYSLAGKDSPYNIEDLHAERQSLRDKINLLETKML